MNIYTGTEVAILIVKATGEASKQTANYFTGKSDEPILDVRKWLKENMDYDLPTIE